MLRQWLDKVVQAGRIVSIGRAGKSLVLVTGRRNDAVTGVREDGRPASFPLERIGRVFAPIFSLRAEKVDAAFDEVHARSKELAMAEPRLRDRLDADGDAVKLIDEKIESLPPASLAPEKRQACVKALWAARNHAEDLQHAERGIESLRADVWEPFALRARVLDRFGYLELGKERVTERGRWLADLHVDHPLLAGEALQRGLFASLDARRTAALAAALTADEDRDYGELELEDEIVTLLSRFEQIAFDVSNEEWKEGIEGASEVNFSAAAAAARWAGGADWSTLVRETRAEEGDLVRLLSRTGEALLQIAGLRQAHAAAAKIAAAAAEVVLREPVR
jgi:hypothetical protein